MSNWKPTTETVLKDEELEAAQGGITLDVEPNDTIQNARASRPNLPSGRAKQDFTGTR